MFTFTDRTSYLAYRAQWKSDYKALSQEIRFTKISFKNAERAYSKNIGSWTAVYNCRSSLEQLKRKANDMLYELTKAKELAGELRAERIAAMIEGV